ncbi:MAG: hypothetical protein HFG85_08710 [Dorea sp.]|jgi:hypothetical protein|nr:hypothetical protein [Dorea sp.]
MNDIFIRIFSGNGLDWQCALEKTVRGAAHGISAVQPDQRGDICFAYVPSEK